MCLNQAGDAVGQPRLPRCVDTVDRHASRQGRVEGSKPLRTPPQGVRDYCTVLESLAALGGGNDHVGRVLDNVPTKIVGSRYLWSPAESKTLHGSSFEWCSLRYLLLPSVSSCSPQK